MSRRYVLSEKTCGIKSHWRHYSPSFTGCWPQLCVRPLPLVSSFEGYCFFHILLNRLITGWLILETYTSDCFVYWVKH
jgi:hypothetical protein